MLLPCKNCTIPHSLQVFFWCPTFPFSSSKLVSVTIVLFFPTHTFSLLLFCTGSQNQWYKDHGTLTYALGKAANCQTQWSNSNILSKGFISTHLIESRLPRIWFSNGWCCGHRKAFFLLLWMWIPFPVNPKQTFLRTPEPMSWFSKSK